MTKITIDPDTFTLDEIEEAEEILGVPIDDAFGKGKPKARVLKALAFIALRRENPDITMEEVGAMSLSAFDLGDEDEGED